MDEVTNGTSPAVEEDEASFASASILVVDDNEKTLISFRAVVERLGHQVTTARSGYEAVHRSAHEEFAAILMDVQMPGMDGFEAVAMIRRHGLNQRTPVIFVTAAYDALEDVLRGYDLGAVDYLTKPVHEQILAAKVTALVSLYRRGQELKRRADIIESKERETAEALEAKRRAEHANRLKDTYVGILGHDLRSPLNAITLTAHTLRNREKLSETGQRAVQRIEHCAGRAVTMVSALVDFTRGQLGGGIPVIRAPTDFTRICTAAIEEVRAAHPERDIHFAAEGQLAGQWDADRAAQALCNLLSNSIRHGTGVVKVRARDTGSGVALTVHNHGEPIPPAKLPTIFEPFRKANPTSDGLGLGLYIVSEIVRAHGGSIHVTSRSADGTTFLTYWPKGEVMAEVGFEAHAAPGGE
jgi:two-component system, sensor histidine kinase and response regulator